MNHFLNNQQFDYSDKFNSSSSFKGQANDSDYERDKLLLFKKRKEIERKLNEGLYNYAGDDHQSNRAWSYHSSNSLSSTHISNINLQHDSDERSINYELKKRIKIDDKFRLQNNSQYFDFTTSDIDQRSLDSDIRKEMSFSPFKSNYSSERMSADRTLSPHHQRSTHYSLSQTNDQDMRNENENTCHSRNDCKEAQNRKKILNLERERIQKKLNESEKRIPSSLKPFDIVGNIIKEQQFRSVTKSNIGDNEKGLKEKLKSYVISCDEEADMIKEIIKLLNDSLLRYELTNLSSDVRETLKEVLEKES